MSTTEETPNKATFRHLTEAMNTGDRDLMSKAIDAAYAPDALIHTPMPVQATGSQAIKEVFGALYRTFSDLHIAVDDLIEEGVGNLTKADRPNTRPTEFSSESTVDEPHEEPVRRRFSRFAQAPPPKKP
jgi:hypothetical protein